MCRTFYFVLVTSIWKSSSCLYSSLPSSCTCSSSAGSDEKVHNCIKQTDMLRCSYLWRALFFCCQKTCRPCINWAWCPQGNCASCKYQSVKIYVLSRLKKRVLFVVCYLFAFYGSCHAAFCSFCKNITSPLRQRLLIGYNTSIAGYT